MRNIGILGGTNPDGNKKYIKVSEELGAMLAGESDLKLLWGGNRNGVLGAIYKQFLKCDRIELHLPKVYSNDLNSMEVKNVTLYEDVLTRHSGMIKNADYLIFLPGGIGTAFELFASIEMLRAKEIKAKIILVNYKGFFNNLLSHYKFINTNGFTSINTMSNIYTTHAKDLFTVVTSATEAFKALKS